MLAFGVLTVQKEVLATRKVAADQFNADRQHFEGFGQQLQGVQQNLESKIDELNNSVNELRVAACPALKAAQGDDDLEKQRVQRLCGTEAPAK